MKIQAGDNIFVRITEHRGILIIDGPEHPEDATLPFEHPDWVPSGGTRLGCVLKDTKKHLGVSAEALELLKKVPPGRDAIGDLMWWGVVDATYAFGWMGPPWGFVSASKAVGDRDYAVHVDHCTIIPNEHPEGVTALIDEAIDKTPDKQGGDTQPSEGG